MTMTMLRFGALPLPLLLCGPLFGCAMSSPENVALGSAPGAAPLSTSPEGGPCEVDLDCDPAEKPCRASACMSGTCKALPIPAGDPCQDGVGVCDSRGECLLPDKWTKCKAWDDRGQVPCDDASECDDGTPCTDDTCEAGWCRHAPLPDGKQCGPNLSCTAGLCCVPW